MKDRRGTLLRRGVKVGVGGRPLLRPLRLRRRRQECRRRLALALKWVTNMRCLLLTMVREDKCEYVSE